MADVVTYCIIEIGGNGIVLPTEDAMKLFPLLCKGEQVTYDWTARQFQRVKYDPHTNNVTLKQLPLAQYAELALNSN